MGSYDKCRVCNKDFYYCPHSWSDGDTKEQDDRIREIVQQELKKHKCPCQTPLGMVVS